MRCWLDEGGVLIGFASAACGSDLLFLEAILELGGEAHVVLPYRRALFAKTSVSIVPGTDWDERFDRVDRAGRVREVSSHKMGGGGVSYDYANRVLHGLASTHARQIGVDLRHLAVWDGRARRRPRGHRGRRPTLASGGSSEALDALIVPRSRPPRPSPPPPLPRRGPTPPKVSTPRSPSSCSATWSVLEAERRRAPRPSATTSSA